MFVDLPIQASTNLPYVERNRFRERYYYLLNTHSVQHTETYTQWAHNRQWNEPNL